MTDMKHTPGPWELSNRLGPKGGEGCYYVSGSHTLHLMVAPDPDGFVYGVNEANARLIAAAPELLEALEEMEAFASRQGWAHVAINKARAAIAKARGQS